MPDKFAYEHKPVLRWKNKASFYSSIDWKNLRLFKLSNNPFCERCEKKEILKPAKEIHHIIDIKDDDSLALDYDNLESLCSDCHKSHTMKDQHERTKSAGIVTKYKF